MARILMAGLSVFSALVLAACCTKVQSFSWIAFELSQEAAEALVAGPAALRTCVGDACWEEAIDANDAGTRWTDAAFDESTRTLSQRQRASPGAKADVTLTASRDGGVLFTHSWADVVFTHNTPNGPLCGGDSYSPAAGALKF